MNTKSEFKLLFVWQEKQEKTYLENMASEGWILKRVWPFYDTFEECSPESYRFEMDYYGANNDLFKQKNELYTSLGWNHVASIIGWHYYCTKNSAAADSPFYTDVTSLSRKYQPLLKILILISAINLILAFINLMQNNNTIWISFIASLIGFYAVYRIQKKIIDFAIEQESD